MMGLPGCLSWTDLVWKSKPAEMSKKCINRIGNLDDLPTSLPSSHVSDQARKSLPVFFKISLCGFFVSRLPPVAAR